MAAPSESGAWSNAVEVSTEQIAQQSAIAKAIKVLRMTRIGVLAYTSVIPVFYFICAVFCYRL